MAARTSFLKPALFIQATASTLSLRLFDRRHSLRLTRRAGKLDEVLLPALRGLCASARLNILNIGYLGLAVPPHSFVSARVAVTVGSVLAWLNQAHILEVTAAEFRSLSYDQTVTRARQAPVSTEFKLSYQTPPLITPSRRRFEFTK